MAEEMEVTGEQVAATGSGAGPTSYDLVPYTSYAYQQSHPNRLAVVATLFGMKPAALEGCRVLELGCASGGNLIPMAAAFPEAQFIGVDLSTRQVADGVKLIEELGLRNIELRVQSITEVDASLGKFDYIICHGVYSWVPEAVRQKIFEVCAERLNPQGVAFVSYNTYPGWHMRGTVREVMLFHVRKWSDPGERVAQARGLLDFLVKSVPPGKNAYAMLLRDEMERLRSTADNYILHEHLETLNEPVYFHQFAEAAAGKGLQFIAEAQSGARWLEALGPVPEQTIRQLAGNVIEYEQYLDFLRNRMFRQSLLCLRDVALARDLDPRRARGFYVASPAICQTPENLAGSGEATFRFEFGGLATSSPSFKTALVILGEVWPEAIHFEQLFEQTLARLGMPVEPAQRDALADNLATNLIHGFTRGVMQLYAAAPQVRAKSETPRTSRLAQLQAAQQRSVTTLLHDTAHLNDLERLIVQLADGSRSEADILDAVLQKVRDQEFTITSGVDPSQGEEGIRAALQGWIHQGLQRLARMGMFCRQ